VLLCGALKLKNNFVGYENVLPSTVVINHSYDVHVIAWEEIVWDSDEILFMFIHCQISLLL
jgi:hypothetical protein